MAAVPDTGMFSNCNALCARRAALLVAWLRRAHAVGAHGPHARCLVVRLWRGWWPGRVPLRMVRHRHGGSQPAPTLWQVGCRSARPLLGVVGAEPPPGVTRQLLPPLGRAGPRRGSGKAATGWACCATAGRGCCATPGWGCCAQRPPVQGPAGHAASKRQRLHGRVVFRRRGLRRCTVRVLHQRRGGCAARQRHRTGRVTGRFVARVLHCLVACSCCAAALAKTDPQSLLRYQK